MYQYEANSHINISYDVITVKAQGGHMGIVDMLSRMLKGDHTPIFSFLLIFSDLCPILTGLFAKFGRFWDLLRKSG